MPKAKKESDAVEETSNETATAAAKDETEEAKEERTTEFHGLESSKCTPGENNAMEDLIEQMTRFLALDKCLPRRQFLSVLNVEAQQPAAKTEAATNETQESDSPPALRFRLEYDPE